MAILLEIYDTFVIRTPSKDETLDGVLAYALAHAAEANRIDIIWDLSKIDMTGIKTEDIGKFVKQMSVIKQYRKGRKTAIICPHDLSFGLMRVFEALIGDVLEIEVNVLRSLREGIVWIKK